MSLTQISAFSIREQIQLLAVVRPTAELKRAVLRVEGKVFDIDRALRGENHRCVPPTFTSMVEDYSRVQTVQCAAERLALVCTEIGDESCRIGSSIHIVSSTCIR